MEIIKLFSSYDGEKLYTIYFSELEARLYNQFQKEFNSKHKKQTLLKQESYSIFSGFKNWMNKEKKTPIQKILGGNGRRA